MSVAPASLIAVGLLGVEVPGDSEDELPLIETENVDRGADGTETR